MSKKLERLQADWTSKPRGRRRVRPYVRRAADRAMMTISIGLGSAMILLVILRYIIR